MYAAGLITLPLIMIPTSSSRCHSGNCKIYLAWYRRRQRFYSPNLANFLLLTLLQQLILAWSSQNQIFKYHKQAQVVMVSSLFLWVLPNA